MSKKKLRERGIGAAGRLPELLKDPDVFNVAVEMLIDRDKKENPEQIEAALKK